MTQYYGSDERLRRLMCNVRSATGETVTLLTPNDLFMQVVELVAAPSVGDATERGLRISMFGLAVGGAYLSALSDAEIMRLAARARMPQENQDSLLANIAKLRADRMAEGVSLDGQCWSIAMPQPEGTARDVIWPSIEPAKLGAAGDDLDIFPTLAVLHGVALALSCHACPYLYAPYDRTYKRRKAWRA